MRISLSQSLVGVLLILRLDNAVATDSLTDSNTIIQSKGAAIKGKSLYLTNCQQCHDADGRALANIDVVAADLTAPDTWHYGTEPGKIFNNIKQGAGLSMPAYGNSLSDEEIWHIVAHILNIGPNERRPTLP